MKLVEGRLVKAVGIKATTTSSKKMYFLMQPRFHEKKTLAQNCPEGSMRIRGGRSGVTLRESNQPAGDHKALGQWLCQRRMDGGQGQLRTLLPWQKGFSASVGGVDLCAGLQGHCGQGSPGTRLDAPEQSQWSSRLFGDGNAAM